MENARLRTFYSGEALEAKRRVKLTGSFVDDTPEVVYADAGETSEVAVEAARKAHFMRPSDTMATRDLVRLYLRLDRREEAVSLIERALRSNRRAQTEAWTLVIQ